MEPRINSKLSFLGPEVFFSGPILFIKNCERFSNHLKKKKNLAYESGSGGDVNSFILKQKLTKANE